MYLILHPGCHEKGFSTRSSTGIQNTFSWLRVQKRDHKPCSLILDLQNNASGHVAYGVLQSVRSPVADSQITRTETCLCIIEYICCMPLTPSMQLGNVKDCSRAGHASIIVRYSHRLLWTCSSGGNTHVVTLPLHKVASQRQNLPHNREDRCGPCIYSPCCMLGHRREHLTRGLRPLKVLITSI